MTYIRFRPSVTSVTPYSLLMPLFHYSLFYKISTLQFYNSYKKVLVTLVTEGIRVIG